MTPVRSSARAFAALLLLATTGFLGACASLESGMRLDQTGERAAGDVPVAMPPVHLITPQLIESERAARQASMKQDVSGLVGKTGAYIIGKGDLLSVLVWNYPELNIAATGAQALAATNVAQTPSAYVVDQAGRIQFPYVGAIEMAGLTEMQARDKLSQGLLKSVKKPDVTLRVLSFRSKKVYVDGEVKTPGNQVIDDVPMTLLEAISRAGGLLASSDQSAIVVSRSGVSHSINLPSLIRQGVNPADILLADGDVVRVRSRDENKVYVLGEVNIPKALPLVNGRMTLTEALGEAGGLSQVSAAGKQVFVVRNDNPAAPLIFNLDAQSPVALALADNFELNPRDVVFVDASGLARFNRVMSLILPNAVGATSSFYNLATPR